MPTPAAPLTDMTAVVTNGFVTVGWMVALFGIPLAIVFGKGLTRWFLRETTKFFRR